MRDREDQARYGRARLGHGAPYAHIEQGRVFPITYNVGEVLDGYETLRRLGSSPDQCGSGHDPLVLQRYPTARPGMEGWIARLDIEPKTS